MRSSKLHLRSTLWLLLAALVALSACGDDAADNGAGGNNADNNANAGNNANNNADAGNNVNNNDNNSTTDADNNTVEPDVKEDADVPDEPDAELCPDQQVSCLDAFGQPDNSLCPEATLCTEGCCVPQFRCTEDAQCAARAGEDENCPYPGIDCLCDLDDGECYTRICDSDALCGDGLVCLGGTCVAPPQTSGLQARVLWAPSALTSGEEATAVVVGYDPNNPEVSLPCAADTCTFAPQGDGALSVGPDGRLSGCDVAGEATFRVSWTTNAQDPGDEFTVRCLGNAPEGQVYVHVVDEQTGAPIEGATVLLLRDEPPTATTDERGFASFEDPDGLLTVSVFAPGRQHVTLAGFMDRDLVVPMSPVTVTDITLDEDTRELDYSALSGVDLIEGTPSFANVVNNGEIEVALSGFGIQQGLLDLNFELIIGPSIRQYLPPNVGLPIPTDDPIEIPGGVTLAFNRQPVVGRYLLTAPPGERTLWSLGGRISISENPRVVSDIIGSVGGNLDIGQIVAVILPLFQDFYSGLTPGVITADAPDNGEARTQDITLTVPTGLRTRIEPPTLPSYRDQRLDGVLVLGGATVPGQGFLPTGASASLDARSGQEPDGRVDPVTLYMSPLHGGLQHPRARYTVALVALDFSQVGGGGDGKEATSILLAGDGDTLEQRATLPRDSFLGFSEEASYNPESRALTLGTVEGADLLRVVFDGPNGQKWVVWAPAGHAGVELPDPTALGYSDPAAQGRGRIVQLSLGHAPLTEGGTRQIQLLDLVDQLTALSILEL